MTTDVLDKFPFFPIRRADLLVKLHSIRWGAMPILLYLPREIRNRTYHGPEHSQRVLAHAKELLAITSKLDFKPNESELFVLESSAWLHDIGYIMPNPKKHPLNTQNLLKKHGKKYFHLDLPERIIISWVCRSHGHSFPLKLVPESLKLGRETVRVRTVAAIFSLADACDIHTRRAPEIVYNIIKDELQRRANRSILHWLINQSVDGVYFSPDEGRIYVNATNLRYAAPAKEHLQEELDRVLPILGTSFPLRNVKLFRVSAPP